MSFELLAMIGSPTQLIIIAAIAFLLFGNRLPSVMRSLGRSVTEFKKGVAGIEEEIDSAVNAEVKKTSSKDAASDKSEE
ncbi:MAG: twin-arginine translocase TatA/TatE family subunit [Thermoguttaceae bacterium]|nr:twin-arginine translocase TatA/TatE family subunit [Thermoguttaceae bacterium]